ncbi:MAG: UDP-3-O-(3-hydroxymyristoyl)glucosamine N-acyltransferase [Candidatus Dactylopiibacterium carminicum]|uniref:UDP-3-O-acylglucosamine N-acyltransferase n=1 Tax=Candidatus Dactylopiibacterium carminicum TaxID=857335 RepID=A0A272EQD3_9RHOO|nr:UDP-3-O-(3-hydroxymyristoyl)glucosamine N-acyltransferase [Candidatus Dactylopiibacterium carminicum]KAF7598550.1 UDP-3-O-(3-hydroxymyristoyl)glucosamine N-acyltransferase [Candidatus Dactylopiibacterium carminicum]PAS92319.1 MAG: UDP-3-O-(3-hydroxymyristoyl)glucosamine N-acyltransferase [Candidatus Dactylopiibacterium carminicum]PAS95904.1 MAG: UDP-3-O-(3-hydroxymyristoyl)glucosamine N-acyltransferase [Candidatus Dactylopiibacterium carminicum]PAS98110.1 MAG: UDP-3-O-(3-hydroxymyristoyl)glu
MSLTLTEIVATLGGELHGDGACRIHQVAPLGRANAGEIGFVAHPKYRDSLDGCKASALVLPPALINASDLPRIIIQDPYLYFARLTQLLNPIRRSEPGVHPTAVVLSPVPASASIGANAYIGENCQVGEGVVISPGCVIGEGCSIGADSYLHAHVILYADTHVGRRCILHAGCVIGSDGFGNARRPDGSWEKIPQIGRAILGDDVEIGANTTVDRGALDDTVVENGARIDNLIQIAHNCRVGEHAAIAGQAGMAGSSTLGKRVMVGGQAGIMGHIDVGDDIVISARSFMSKSVMERGVYTSAIPSQSHKEWLRNAVHLKHLDAMADRIRALENKLKELESKA